MSVNRSMDQRKEDSPPFMLTEDSRTFFVEMHQWFFVELQHWLYVGAKFLTNWWTWMAGRDYGTYADMVFMH